MQQHGSRRAFLALLAGVPLLARAARSKVVIYPPPESELDERSAYRIELLRLALGKRYTLQPGELVMQQGRALRYIEQQHGINVFWSMTSKLRERQLLPIRIPIDRGLLGWRLLLIRKEDEARFARIESVAQLAGLHGAQGHDWPDFEILRAAGLDVYPSPHYESLFNMLARGRVDYVPRAVSEIADELANHNTGQFAIAPRLALHYPAAEYFFVHRQRADLAREIEAGLRRALADGSFDALFREYHAKFLTQADLANRHVLQLPNPLLPAATPLSSRQYWYSPR
jgi:hypothetical protein